MNDSDLIAQARLNAEQERRELVAHFAQIARVSLAGVLGAQDGALDTVWHSAEYVDELTEGVFQRLAVLERDVEKEER